MCRVACGVRQGGSGWWVLVKGSPEAIGARLAEGQRPRGYEERAAKLAKGGMRVLALAYKRPRTDAEAAECEESRAVAEKELLFAGFVAFSCRVRKDTRKVVLQLREGAHDVSMVTGDAILTAVHVAIEVSGPGPVRTGQAHRNEGHRERCGHRRDVEATGNPVPL